MIKLLVMGNTVTQGFEQVQSDSAGSSMMGGMGKLASTTIEAFPLEGYIPRGLWQGLILILPYEACLHVRKLPSLVTQSEARRDQHNTLYVSLEHI